MAPGFFHEEVERHPDLHDWRNLPDTGHSALDFGPAPQLPLFSGTKPGSDPLAKLEHRMQRIVPRWLPMTRAGGGWTVVLGLHFLILSQQPVYHTDIWGHLAYGRWIREHARLPQTEPLLPLCEGVPVVDSAWLSQLIGFGVYRQFGVTVLQFLYAAAVTTAVALLLWGVLRRTGGSLIAGVVALVSFAWVDSQQLLIVRPQLAGLVCFVAVFVLLGAPRWRKANGILIPLLFLLWANLHGSWIVGLLLLGTLGMGRAIDVARRMRNITAPAADVATRRFVALTAASAGVVLINPYGFDLYPEVISFAGNPNLQDLIEWKPLTLEMSQGRAAAAAAVALLVAYLLTPRRVRSAEPLLLIGLGGAAVWHSRMLHWWAPIAAGYLALHVAAIARRWRRARRIEASRSAVTTIAALAFVGVCFALTPFGATLVRGRPETARARARELAASTSRQTPITAAAYLHRSPVEGLVYNTHEWGDFLQFAGPRDLQLFTNSHAHLIPPDVWQDALAIRQAAPGWDDTLDRYRVNALVLSVRIHRGLIQALKQSPDTWELAHQDRVAVVFRRKRQPRLSG